VCSSDLDTMSFDISIALSLAPILHVLRGWQNQCFGNCMGLAKLSNSMSNYIRCLQTLLGDGGSLLLEAITLMFKEVHRLLFLTFTNQKRVHSCVCLLIQCV